MPKRKKSHAYTDWIKSRLDEMDATLFVLEDKAENLESDVSAKAGDALDSIRSWRDSFKARVNENIHDGEKAWADIKIHLDKDWKGFEDAVQARMDARKDSAG